MKELIVIPEYHRYACWGEDLQSILNEMDKLLDKLLGKSNITLEDLEPLAKAVRDYIGDKKHIFSLRGQMEWASGQFKIAKRLHPDTLFLEMLEDAYIEKACELFNRTHDAEKVFEALLNHFLVEGIQKNITVIQTYREFFADLNDEQKAKLIPPQKLLEEVLRFKRVLYKHWHDSLGELLATCQQLYIIKTGDTAAMIKKIIEKKDSFKNAVVICGAAHAVDFAEQNDLFESSGIELISAPVIKDTLTHFIETRKEGEDNN